MELQRNLEPRVVGTTIHESKAPVKISVTVRLAVTEQFS